MKNFLAFFILTIVTITTISAREKNQSTKNESKELKITIDTLKTKTVVDTLRVQVLSQSKEKEQNDRPWQIALLIGVLTFSATIFASLINRRITLKGIGANKETAINQIENAQLITIQQFNSTLKTKNRQEWVNDLRNTMSEFIANCAKINLEFQDRSENHKERIKDIHEKITLNRTKLRLLLDPKKELHEKLLNSMGDFVSVVDEHVLNYRANIDYYKNGEFISASDEVIENARILLYSEWQKIQKLIDEKKPN